MVLYGLAKPIIKIVDTRHHHAAGSDECPRNEQYFISYKNRHKTSALADVGGVCTDCEN